MFHHFNESTAAHASCRRNQRKDLQERDCPADWAQVSMREIRRLVDQCMILGDKTLLNNVCSIMAGGCSKDIVMTPQEIDVAAKNAVTAAMTRRLINDWFAVPGKPEQ